jgi:mono/diheme cytochrome c family protein
MSTSRTSVFIALAAGIAACGSLIAAQAPRTVWAGVYTEAQAVRGKQAYIDNCASCHGEGLQGADLAPALKGEDFLLRWSAQPVHGLATAIAKTMPLTAPGSLSDALNADITAYVLQVNKFPAGKTELPSDEAGLKSIDLTLEK